MKNQENPKEENSNQENKNKQKKRDHIKEAEERVNQLSEEEQEELRRQIREKYSRFNGCGG
jgi:hypothetical protein